MKLRKDTVVTISVPKTERDRWRKYAEKKGMSLSGFTRQALNVYIMMIDLKEKEIKNKRKQELLK